MKGIQVAIFLLFCSLGSSGLCADDSKKTAIYAYEDNKRLVDLVENAASLIESKGKDAFKAFSVKGSKWLTDRNYIFVYDDAGICVFHPIEPDLIGQQLLHFRDIEGRAVIELFLEIARTPQPDTSGWVFYLWENPKRGHLAPKASYIRKAFAPDGKIYLVGSGLYNIKIEKAFIKERVDKAAALIRRKGKEIAFCELEDASCPLHVMDSYIMVTDTQGNVVVDPMYPNLIKKRNVSRRCDLVGKNVFIETRNSLAHQESTWICFIEPKPGANHPERHLSYIRKVITGNEVFYVGANFVPVAPIWMK